MHIFLLFTDFNHQKASTTKKNGNFAAKQLIKLRNTILLKMRKYLILCAAAFLASCTKDVEPVEIQEEKEKTFESNFNSTFGVSEEVYANHDWGMNKMPLVDISDNTTAATRGVNANGNEWASKGYVVPGEITASEREAVLAVFNQKGKESYQSLVDWDCYFVQQVYKGVAQYRNHAGGTVTGSDHMDWLCTVTDKKANVVSWWPYKEEIVTVSPYDDHINNFNSGNNYTYGGIMLMVNTNSDKFGFKSSEDNGHVFYNFRMEKINGNYYVGFDFEANGYNPNEKVDRDYIYNDWIVKIVPGKGSTPSVERVRVMCEDLGSSRSDFDYNDVVFDIKFYKNGSKYTADIILQAIGGELPLTIGGQEVHNLFGVATNTMMNTYEGRHSEKAPVQFQVELPSGTYNNAFEAINALPVIVRLGNNKPIQLTVNPGKPAEMIAVKVSTDWADERVSILDKYPSFVNWIKDSDTVWYE